MSRASLKEQRLRFFRLGNTFCPICLTPFTEAEVGAGKVVTLEHAPQQSVGGKPACLTCADCNTGKATGAVDRAVADYYRARDDGGYPIIVEGGTGPYKVHPKYIRRGEQTFTVRTRRDVVGGSRGPFTLRWTEPHPDAILLGLLKSAYLMVFCLLNKAGRRYAQGGAVSCFREQLLSPETELVRPLVWSTDTANTEHAVLLVPEYQCWAVKIRTDMVVLPPGGSIDHYRKLERLLQPPLSLGSTVRWPAIRFGDVIPIAAGKPDALKAEALFGKRASFRRQPDDDYENAVVVYDDSDMFAVLRVSGPPGSESRETMADHQQ